MEMALIVITYKAKWYDFSVDIEGVNEVSVQRSLVGDPWQDPALESASKADDKECSIKFFEDE